MGQYSAIAIDESSQLVLEHEHEHAHEPANDGSEHSHSHSRPHKRAEKEMRTIRRDIRSVAAPLIILLTACVLFSAATKSTKAPKVPTVVATPEPPPPPPPLPVFRSAAPLYNQYDVCTDFCKGAITTCEGVVDWVTNTYATPLSRHIDGGAGTDATGKPEEQFDACHNTCMGWVYWRQDAQPDFTQRFFNGYAIGDSLNCRYNHLQFASGIPSFPYGLAASESESAPQHCQHITPDAGWVCTDYRRDSDNKTPPQLYKEAMFTKHRVGDCWLAADDKIADCHRKALNDGTIDQQLLWVPDDIEYIFLHANALTKVPDLSRFTDLKGIYLENNALTVLESDDFASNSKLEILNLSNNFITEIPDDLLASVTDLKSFFFNFNYVTAIPATLFGTTTDIELISLVDNKLTEFEAGTFAGLGSLKLLAFGQQGKAADRGKIFSADGIPDGLFDDLVSLEYFSTFINAVGVLKESWFGDWSANLEVIAIFLYQTGPVPPLVIEDGVFDKLPSLIDIAAYSSGNVIEPTDVSNNPNLLTVLYGSQFDILAPLPEPALYNAALI